MEFNVYVSYKSFVFLVVNSCNVQCLAQIKSVKIWAPDSNCSSRSGEGDAD